MKTLKELKMSLPHERSWLAAIPVLLALILLLLSQSAASLFHKGNQSKASKPANSLEARLLGGKDFRNFEVNLEEFTISSNSKGYEIELRDRRQCHGSTDPDTPCTAIIWNVDPSGKFISREEYHFANGMKVWLGRIDSLGMADKHWEATSYGIGNPIPYVFQTYPDNAHDRRIYQLQDQVDNVIKDIPAV